jgi:uncharacterized membrane protein
MKKNPLLNHPPKSTPSHFKIAEHPIHAMLVAFPIAYLMGGLASDVAFWWTGDPFWARVSLWIIGMGLLLGLAAGAAGTIEFIMVPEIRHHVTSWSHFLAAVMMLSLTAANWWLRVPDPAERVLPWGMFLSAVTAAALSMVGWLGGKLVFEYRVGTGADE